ncbi:TIGR03757 family integrating conjugative element protein [Cedecea sp. NFIX57]|uniref:TIGR03757 family integrating conjugative element protein n=1 Tax=Cedecea sp. NFIX57 TaxID=1566286 RepID=UPI000A0E3A0A|nr:TIGR03757 family integrating conjugative element protein [Cedecea sp. NFIX57]SMG61698.1 integrating conjugative element protein, PFL_4709 family [Cedecea sp. NFIX57]
MHISSALFFSVLLSAPALAATVVYTDSQHPPVNLPPDTQVVWLDGPDRLQTQFFGALPADPMQAEAQVRAVLQSPDWQAHQQQIAEVYRGIVHARELGVAKFPAVVFDDTEVVYGTADVARATTLKAQGDQP